MMWVKDFRGQRYGLLTALRPILHTGTKYYWLCQCDCGRKKIVEMFAAKCKELSEEYAYPLSCGCNRVGISQKRIASERKHHAIRICKRIKAAANNDPKAIMHSNEISFPAWDKRDLSTIFSIFSREGRTSFQSANDLVSWVHKQVTPVDRSTRMNVADKYLAPENIRFTEVKYSSGYKRKKTKGV